ncbi:MAG: glycosyltransferase family 2 protein [Thermoplasmata archaeon]
MRCSTIVLLYNEEDNVERQTIDLVQAYEDLGIEGEILLMDDGSLDDTGRICDDLSQKYPNVRTVHHARNKGRSWAIETGFECADGDVLFIMDGDCQYEPKEIPQFLKKIEEGYDVVSGNRFDRADDWIRRLISKVYNRVIVRGFLGLQIQDQNSGFKAFTKEAALGMGFKPDGYLGLHRFILPLAHVKGYSVTEVDIKHYDRERGKSYIKPSTVVFITFRDFIRFRKEHMRGR